MSRILPIASSSSGNCTYIRHKNTGILVDVGISCKAITDALKNISVNPFDLKAIFITHEHTDHIYGLRVFTKKYHIPIYASKGTAQALLKSCIQEYSHDINIIENSVDLGDIVAERFPTSHDCNDSSGYVFKLSDGKKCAVCTDLGYVSEEVHNAISGCEALLFESNHDINMLQKGSYPEVTKQRIMSNRGHLSNVACSSEMKKLVLSGTTRFILGHLSKENNRPEIAHSCAVSALMDCGFVEDEDYTLYIAPPKNGKSIIF